MIWTIISFIIAALVLFLLEILTPFFGLIVTAGIGFLVGAIWLTFAEFGPVAGFILLVASIVLVPAYIAFLIRVLPKSPIGRRLFLGKARRATAEGTPEAEQLEAMVGKTGMAETPLRPTGAVRIDSRRVIASAESGMIEKGDAVTVIGASGTNVIVRKV